MKHFSPYLIASTFALGVLGHGYVDLVTIGGKQFPGSVPVDQLNGKAPAKDGVIRVIQTKSPVKNVTATHPEITCGWDPVAVHGIAVGNAGDMMQFEWANAAASNGFVRPSDSSFFVQHLIHSSQWIHNVGPILTYMAKCEPDCATFKANAKTNWFKIDQQSFDASTGTWVQQKIMNGAPSNVTIPKTLKSGQYLVRHEIIALHTAASLHGAEFYPSCTQLNVENGGSGGPADSELVHFPGAYKPRDPGILVDVFTPTIQATYTFPGPDVAAFVNSSSSSGGVVPSSPSTSSATPSTHNNAANSTASAVSGVCKKKKRSVEQQVVRPRYYSRIMRNIGLEGL